jgi:LEA14-like dessication related protein
MKKNKPWIIGGVLIALLATILFFNTSVLLARFYPKVGVNILQYNQVNLKTVKMNVEVTVENRLPFGMSFNGISLKIGTEDTILLQTIDKAPFSLNANSSSKIKLPIKLNVPAIKEKSKNVNLATSEETEYVFETIIYNKPAWYLPKSLEFSHTEKLPTFKFPKVEFERLERVKGNKNTNFIAYLKITNFNTNAIKIKHPKFNIKVDDTQNVVTGLISETIVINPKSARVYPVPMHVDVKKAILKLPAFVGNRKNTMLFINLKSIILTENPMIDGCHFETNISGNVNEIMKRK